MTKASHLLPRIRHAYLTLTGEVPPTRGVLMVLTFSVMTLLALNAGAVMWGAFQAVSVENLTSIHMIEGVAPMVLLSVGCAVGTILFARGYLHLARSTEASVGFLNWIANRDPCRR